MDVRKVRRGRAGWRRLEDRPAGASSRRPLRGTPPANGRRLAEREDDGFGEAFWLALRKEVPFDRSGPSYDIVQRAAKRVQARYSPRRRFLVEVPWVTGVPAFTVAGRYVYVSRHLVDRFPDEAGIALVIAHEIAHHELGHVYTWTRWVRRARRVLPEEGALTAGLIAAAAQAYLTRPEWEVEADRLALRICRRAGYGPGECLRLFDHLETLSLERRDIDGVFGPEDARGEAVGAVERWLWRRRRRYPALRFRREALTANERAAEARDSRPANAGAAARRTTRRRQPRRA
jgi:hypothetical protein